MPLATAESGSSLTVTGKPVNHPGNLGAVYRFVAELLDEPIEAVAKRVEENFKRLFGGIAG